MTMENTTGGCSEFLEMSRRRFLGTAGAAATAPSWMPRVAMAKDYRGGARDALVVIFLRGGADSMSMCVPCFDDHYYTARPTIAVPRPDSSSANRAIDLDGAFGVPPAMAPLVPLYREGKVLFVHAVGSPDSTRSHFEAMREMELGRAAPETRNGWLTRHLANVGPLVPSAPLRAVSLNPSVARSLLGSPTALPLPTPTSFNLLGDPITQASRYAHMYTSYQAAPEPVRSFGLVSFGTVAALNELNIASYQPQGGAEYPNTRSGAALKATAALIKAQIGVEAVTVDLSAVTWDTHQLQDPLTGVMANEMAGLANCLAAFGRDMFAGSSTFSLVVMSEFGRSLYENGSRGTDHGHGGAMIIMGNAVNGGRVLARWPGLAPENLYGQRDLATTIDYRDVLGEILERRLGNTRLSNVFDDYTPQFQGVLL